MDKSTVLDYSGLPAERIEYWAHRALREWACRPKPIWTYLKSTNNWQSARSAINVGCKHWGGCGEENHGLGACKKRGKKGLL